MAADIYQVEVYKVRINLKDIENIAGDKRGRKKEPFEVQARQGDASVGQQGSLNLGCSFQVHFDGFIHVVQLPVFFIELTVDMNQLFLKIDHSCCGLQTDFQFSGVKRLGYEIIGSGLHAKDDVFLVILAGQQNDIDIAGKIRAANSAAEFQPLEARHQPVGENNVGLFCLNHVPPDFTI